MVAIVQLVEHLIVVQDVAGSSPVSHPICTRFANQRSFEPQKSIAERNSLSEGEHINVPPSDMLDYLQQLQRQYSFLPRTFWVEFPFYKSIRNSKQSFLLGYRPENLSGTATLNQRSWKKHKAHLNRLDRFSLEKADYYLRLKEVYNINTVRGLSNLTGESWSYIAKILKISTLPELIKEFLRSHKKDPKIMKLFTFRRLLAIVRKGSKKLQLEYFRALIEVD